MAPVYQTSLRPMTLRRLGTLLVLALSAALLGVVAIGTGQALAAVLAAIAAAFGLALAAQADRYESVMEAVADAGEWALALAPGLLVVYFSFNGGGYFPGSQAFVALVLALVLALRMWLASEPLAGFGPLSTIAAGLLALYGTWIALSASWSHAPGRALVELDTVILYLLALLLFASLTRSTERIRLMVRGIAAAAVLVCLVGLITRVLPDVWPIAPDIQRGRLSYPLTYWNALGLLAALGLVLCVHLASSEREPRLSRVLGAAAMPVLGTALFFTFSRGAIGVAILGLVGYALLARPRGLIGGMLAAAPATAIAVVTAYHADLLASDDPTTAAATSQGHHVALIVAGCVIGAAAVRAVTLKLDDVLARARLPLTARARRVVPAAGWTLGAAVLVVVFFGAGGPHQVSANYHRFVHGNAVVMSGDLRSRLGDPGNNRRIDQWRVAWSGYTSDPFKGVGSGTYENLWNRKRPLAFEIRDAHSLYVEVLGELGFTGMALLGGALGLIVFGFARGVWRGRDRYVYAALLAAALAWLVRAGIDWDWEMPAITIWLFCAGGATLAVSSRHRTRRLRVRPGLRLAMSLGCLALALVPAAMAVSEHRLNEAKAAFARGNCRKAESEARGSLHAVGFRSEPQEVIAVCAARRGALAEALPAAREAVRHDPGNWRYHYDAALLLAATGADARPAAIAAAALNPRDPTAAAAPSALTGAGARARAVALLDGVTP
jgi:O-antigen ligase